jgi:RHS repeat-associated protein
VLEPWGDPSGGYDAFEVVSLGGRHIAFYNENNPRGTYFVHPNALGSDSNWTDWGGNLLSEQIYAPWGQELVSGGQTPRFAGMSHRDQTGFDVTPARDYSSTMGRWLTPDPAGKGAVRLDDPQTWNMYAYVRNSPTTLTDPSGLCDRPSGLKPGQVGICVASFIEKSFFWLVGRGDRRGPEAQAGTSRIETRLIVDPNKHSVTKTNETINRSGILIKDVGPRGVGGSSVSQPTTDKQGNTQFQVSQDAHSSYALGGLIFGSIDNHLNLKVTPNGEVGIDPGSSARDFPSLEVFRYTVDEEGNVTTSRILFKEESGNVSDLKGPEKPIAPEDPR